MSSQSLYDFWTSLAPKCAVVLDGQQSKQTTEKPVINVSTSITTLPSDPAIGDNVLNVVYLQQADNQPRAVASGHQIPGLQNPFPYLGNDPALAAKYALLESAATAIQTALASEAIGIGLKSGLDAKILYQAIAGAAGSSWSFRQHGEEMLGLGGSKPGQTFEQAQSALELALTTAQNNKFYAPLTTLAKQVYTVAATKYQSPRSSSAVSQTWVSTPRYMNGVEPMGTGERLRPSKVGFVGLGAMGMGMANVLRSAGVDVVGFDAWRPSIERYASDGGTTASSMIECAKGAEVFLLMVINAAQAEQVLFEQNALANLPPNATILMMCTVSPSQAVALAAKVSDARPDVSLVDAPVSGGTPRAASGDLTILASGLPRDAGKVLYVLDKLSGTQGNTHNLFMIPGGAGMGAAVKLVNQHLAAETLAFAASLGLPLRQTRELILSGPAQTWMMGHRGKHMLDGLIQPPTSTIDIFVKDTSIVANEARRLGVPAPLISLVQQQFIFASACGWGRDDDCGLVRMWKPSGIDVVCPK